MKGPNGIRILLDFVLYKFPSIFILFHFVLLLLSSFMDSLLSRSSLLSLPLALSLTLSLTHAHFSNLFSLHLLRIGAWSARSICEIIQNNIWKSTSVDRWFHKLFTSYTTKYRHRYIDTTWTWWFVYVFRSEDEKGPNDCIYIHYTYIELLNLYMKLHIYWILPNAR